MKPDYKNWMPKGMVLGSAIGAGVSILLLIVFGCTPLLSSGGVKTVLTIVFAVISLLMVIMTLWMFMMYQSFSYNGKRQMSRQIIEGLAHYVHIPDEGVGLDVGCGSGALTIACAKRNPKATMIGIDRWGKEYASFNKALCVKNSMAEGASNTSFRQGDAVKLDFDDESFDVVTSNYVYHNIPSSDRQKILLETLRTLKKGGTFVIHDIMSKAKYGDMESFVKKLRSMGYEKVELVDTTKGIFMTPFEATWMGLSGSKILMGKK